MKEVYTFHCLIGERPIFMRNGEYFYADLIDNDQLAYGLLTEDPEGFRPVSSLFDYERIQEIEDINKQLRQLALVGIDKGKITVAIEYAGDYEYFKLSGISPQDLTDQLALQLAGKVDLRRESKPLNPYVYELKDNKLK